MKPLNVLWEGKPLEVAGFKIRCYVLTNGQRVFDADDVLAFVEAVGPGGKECDAMFEQAQKWGDQE